MAVLSKKDYYEIIFKTNDFPEILDISDHFISEHRNNITDNPRFSEKLKGVIESLKVKIGELREQRIEKEKKDNYRNPDGSPKEKNDYLGYNFSADKLGVGLIQYPGGSRLSINKINNIEKAYELFTGKINNSGTPGVKQKIRWRGELKEFAELLVSLEKKQWIELPDGELNPIVKTLCLCFDFSGTKRKENSNTENSLLQYLKPSERELKIYTKRYQTKFDSIYPINSEK